MLFARLFQKRACRYRFESKADMHESTRRVYTFPGTSKRKKLGYSIFYDSLGTPKNARMSYDVLYTFLCTRASRVLSKRKSVFLIFERPRQTTETTVFSHAILEQGQSFHCVDRPNKRMGPMTTMTRNCDFSTAIARPAAQ